MIKTKNIQELLPTGKTTYRLSNRRIKDAFIGIIRMYTIEALEHRMNTYAIQECINKIKDIRIHTSMSPRDIEFTRKGILYLPEFFFKRKLDSQEDIIEMIDEYPILGELLCAYGIYVVGTRSYYSSSKDYEIKKLIAHYFARQNFSPTMEKVNYAGKVFNSHGNIYTLEDNFFAEIENIFGNEILINTLKYSILSFDARIQIYTEKKGVGLELLKCILELSKLTSKEETLATREETDQSIKNKLIKPLYEETLDYRLNYQIELAYQLGYSEFDPTKFGEFMRDDIFRNFLAALSEYERDTIKLYVLDFKRKFYELRPFLFTAFPQITPAREFMGAQDFKEEDFTDINRIMTMINANAHEKDILDTEILELWNKIQKLIIKTILPKSLDPYSGIRMSQEDFCAIADLSTYQDRNTGNIEPFGKVHQIQKLSEKNRKTD